jgi:hypothetical protein
VPTYRIGQRVVLTQNALDNYGELYRGVVFLVTEWYDHYVPTSRPGWENDSHGHPGFNAGAGGVLYSIKGIKGEAAPGDVYSWELRASPR